MGGGLKNNQKTAKLTVAVDYEDELEPINRVHNISDDEDDDDDETGAVTFYQRT